MHVCCVRAFAYYKQQKFDVGKFGKFAYFAKLNSSKILSCLIFADILEFAKIYAVKCSLAKL